MGVLADLSGKAGPDDPVIPVDDRKLLEIDVDNFNERLKAMKPHVAFDVPNVLTGEGNFKIDLTFESLDDFSPAAIARKSEGGPPAAVKRIADPKFPLAFELGPQDSMVPGIEFTGPLSLKARLSRSGDAMPRAGDIEGFHPDPVEPGQSGIEILLAQVR